ncbi:hypothetical protein SBADM41S_06346 [Streptomyces badius]
MVRGITAMNGTPMSLAKYASDTAVEPLDASMTGLPGLIQPLQSPYRKSERARRCLRLPVGCVDSSLRYRSMPHASGSGKRSRWVSAERLASAWTLRTASFSQDRYSGSLRSMSTVALAPLPDACSLVFMGLLLLVVDPRSHLPRYAPPPARNGHLDGP